MRYDIAVVPGDGIGPEVTGEAVRVLKKATNNKSYELMFAHYLAGGCAIDETGVPLPPETLEGAKKSGAVLLGAVGGPKWDALPSEMRPEKALLGLRFELKLFANLRPAILFGPLSGASPLKESVIGKGMDILVVRELTGGLYYGRKGSGEDWAYDTLYYTEDEVRRIAHIAMKAAQKRGLKVTSVDKSNILESSRLWRRVVTEVAKEYPQIELSHIYVDNASMQLIKNPSQFDVIVTENTFGDILSDEAAMITGSIGLLPSASIGMSSQGIYEPIHGSAPDIAGLGVANPLAAIMSAAMMMRYSFSQEETAKNIENAVARAIASGARTKDIATGNEKVLSTMEMADAVIEYLEA